MYDELLHGELMKIRNQATIKKGFFDGEIVLDNECQNNKIYQNEIWIYFKILKSNSKECIEMNALLA